MSTGTLTLTENTAACLEVTSELTLNLGGYTPTNEAVGCNTIWVHGDGVLTITGEGAVTNTADSLYPVVSLMTTAMIAFEVVMWKKSYFVNK